MTAQVGPFAAGMIGASRMSMSRHVPTGLIPVTMFRTLILIMTVMLFIGFIKVVKLYVEIVCSAEGRGRGTEPRFC